MLDSSQEVSRNNELTPEENASLWRQYAVYVDLFKFYVGVVLQATVWYYAVTAAIVAFYLVVSDRGLYTRLALLFPALFGALLCGTFVYGSVKATELRANVETIRQKLNLIGAVHVSVLVWFLRAAAVMFLLVSVALFLQSR